MLGRRTGQTIPTCGGRGFQHTVEYRIPRHSSPGCGWNLWPHYYQRWRQSYLQHGHLDIRKFSRPPQTHWFHHVQPGDAFFFFFPPHLFPRLSVALHDCFTGQSPGTRLARRARRAKVQGPGMLRQGGGGDWRKEGLAGLPPRVGSSWRDWCRRCRDWV